MVNAILVKTPGAAHGNLRASYEHVATFLKTTTMSALRRHLQAPQLHAANRVIPSLLENQVRPLAGRPYILAQVDEVDRTPDLARGLHGLVGCQRGVAMKIRGRVTEDGVAQGKEALDVPLLHV